MNGNDEGKKMSCCFEEEEGGHWQDSSLFMEQKRGGGGEMVLGFSLESAYGLFNDPTGLVLEPRAAEVLHFTGSNHWWGVWNTGVTAASGPPATLTHTENGF